MKKERKEEEEERMSKKLKLEDKKLTLDFFKDNDVKNNDVEEI
jgi:hypothetical protein